MSEVASGRDAWAGDAGLLMLRLGCGLTMALQHGWAKATAFLAGSTAFPDPLGLGAYPSLGLAALGELSGLAVALGLLTRPAAGLAAATMAVAFFVYHAGDPLGERELALLYLIGFATLTLTGGGRWSLDRLWRIRGRPARGNRARSGLR
ncbi:MAG TPA: DoxX family protein [Thermoanaerobaculia bacterium]|nr:DoxX family protein [Thermoanaerobaculia bacterium]